MVELAPAAVRDLRRLRRSPDLPRIREALLALGRNAQDAQLDIRALEGRSPWLRLRVGDWRILFRPLAAAEQRALGRKATTLVARIVNRRDLLRATRGL